MHVCAGAESAAGRNAGDRPRFPIRRESAELPQCRGNRRSRRVDGDTEPADEHGAKRSSPLWTSRSRGGSASKSTGTKGAEAGWATSAAAGGSRLAGCVAGWSTSNTRNRRDGVRCANESSPAPKITYWSIPELPRIGHASAKWLPARRFGMGTGQDQVGIVEPMVGQEFLGVTPEEAGREGVGEDERLGVDEQMSRACGGGREGGPADAGSISGKLGEVHGATVSIGFRAYHEIELRGRRRAFRPACGHSGRGRPARSSGHCGRFRVSRVPGMIRHVRVCPTVFWRR